MNYFLFLSTVILIAKIAYPFIKPKPYEKRIIKSLPEASGAEKEKEFYISNDYSFTDWSEEICLN